MKNRMTYVTMYCLYLFLAGTGYAQSQVFTHQDTLRGAITSERKWWDVTYYDLEVAVNIAERSIAGTNSIFFQAIEPGRTMQIDLQEPMVMTRVVQDGKDLEFSRDGSAWFIDLQKEESRGCSGMIQVYYNGVPKTSKRPPWDGGFTWTKDSNGKDFIATANQGEGASLWWPCKDHPYDEADSMRISVRVPGHLMNVSNGRLRSIKDNKDGTRSFRWFVSNPINNYGVNINIGDYVHFSEVYDGEKGPLDCNYYVLRENLEKAKVHFADAARMLESMEYWFGPYPFYEDSYKLVEVPYPGMEHQSSVTYGNGYKNGFMGRDISGSGWGLKFDFIIIHESGHEWFANSITNSDVADMWIHESFIAYSENLFVNYFWGKKASAEYVIGTRRRIFHDRPLIGTYNVANEGSHDMYYKGSNMLHTLRQIVDNDSTWRSILRGLNREFYHQTVCAEQIEGFINDRVNLDLTPFFNQYLRDIRIPVLEYVRERSKLIFRWTNCVDGFNMPVRVKINGVYEWLKPAARWQEFNAGTTVDEVSIDPNFYVAECDLVPEIE